MPAAFAVACIATCALGAMAVFSSAMIYAATGRELWSLRRTLGEFAATGLGLGLAVVSLAMPLAARPPLLAIASVVCGAALIPKWLDWRRSEEARGVCSNEWSVRSGRLLHEPLAYQWRVACCSLAMSLCVSLLAMLYACSDHRQANPQTLAWLHGLAWGTSVSLLLISQSTVRWLGFTSVVFPRMPGAST
jgi:hypothetical protein